MKAEVKKRAVSEAKSLHRQMGRSDGTVEAMRRLIDHGGLLDRRDPEEREAWDFRALVLREFNKLVNGKGKR